MILNRFISLSLALLATFFASCYSSSCDDCTSVDAPPPEIQTEPERPGTQLTDFFVFVGEKREITPVQPPEGEIWFDVAVDAKYRVIQPVYGEFDGNIIEFRALDHFGRFPFTLYKHVLLFVSKYKGKLYHEKYQYYDVNQTVDGRWASCGDPYRFDDYHRKPFAPEKLEFSTPPTFDVSGLNDKKIRELYPSPYFEIENGRAVCKMGAYVDQLLKIKRDGVLKARGVGQ